jgi:L-amino acid N-acyltransferase YncA
MIWVLDDRPSEPGPRALDRPGLRGIIGEMGTVRAARPEDCEEIAGIYNEAIAERTSTFETDYRATADVERWLGSPDHPVLVATSGGAVAGWARISEYSPRPCYAGVGEGSVYVRGSQRGHGLGGALVLALTQAAERAGYHKIVGKLFADNIASLRLVARHGFREVGLHLRHGRLDGEWRDVVLVELLVGEAARPIPVARHGRDPLRAGPVE